VVTYAWGLLVIVPAILAMDEAPVGAGGEATPSLASATDRVKRLVTVELLRFMVIFTCMILMRFGL
jgi:hypothetical protein